MMPELNLVELEVSQVENEVKSFQQQEELVYKGTEARKSMLGLGEL